jgi:hypothetical protein
MFWAGWKIGVETSDDLAFHRSGHCGTAIEVRSATKDFWLGRMVSKFRAFSHGCHLDFLSSDAKD